ncbi:hypothetical protein DRP04_11840 [Archaeoglobales archaeon]|nr:MAG: hypothetical protein DRP04_11840 [Archaeoglobales archaeon]
MRARTLKSESIVRLLKEKLEGLFPDMAGVADFELEESNAEFRIFWHEIIDGIKGIVSSMDCENGRCRISLVVDHATSDEIEGLRELENLIEDMYKGVKCDVHTGLLVAGGASIVCYGSLENLEPAYMDVIDHAYKLIKKYKEELR